MIASIDYTDCASGSPDELQADARPGLEAEAGRDGPPARCLGTFLHTQKVRYADASWQYYTHVRHVTAPEVSVVSLSLCQCPNPLKLLV